VRHIHIIKLYQNVALVKSMHSPMVQLTVRGAQDVD